MPTIFNGSTGIGFDLNTIKLLHQTVTIILAWYLSQLGMNTGLEAALVVVQVLRSQRRYGESKAALQKAVAAWPDDIRLRPKTRYVADLAGSNLVIGTASAGSVAVVPPRLAVAVVNTASKPSHVISARSCSLESVATALSRSRFFSVARS